MPFGTEQNVNRSGSLAFAGLYRFVLRPVLFWFGVKWSSQSHESAGPGPYAYLRPVTSVGTLSAEIKALCSLIRASSETQSEPSCQPAGDHVRRDDPSPHASSRHSL